MAEKNWIKSLSLILLALAIGFSPSFSAGVIEGGRVLEIRVEDILLIILGLIWISSFLISGKIKIEKPPLFFPILAWVGINFFSVLTNWTFANLSYSQGFFFFLKDVEFFFLYFYVFYHIKNYDQIKFIIKTWIFIGLVHIGWILYEITTGARLTYYYGPTPFIEPEGPLPAGGFFLMIFIFFLNIFLFHYLNQRSSKLKKGLLFLVVMSPALGVISSGSRVSFFGFIFALILIFFLYFIKKGISNSFLMVLLIAVFVAGISVLVFSEIPSLNRLIDPDVLLFELSTKQYSTRLSIWKNQIMKISERPLLLFFGFGKSFLLAGQQSHSQYLKNLVETGIIGSLIFLFLIFVILKKSFEGFRSRKDSLARGLSAGLFVATLTMLLLSIAGEAFMVVKPNEVYWFFAALTMTVFSFSKKEKSKNHAKRRS